MAGRGEHLVKADRRFATGGGVLARLAAPAFARVLDPLELNLPDGAARHVQVLRLQPGAPLRGLLHHVIGLVRDVPHHGVQVAVGARQVRVERGLRPVVEDEAVGDPAGGEIGGHRQKDEQREGAGARFSPDLCHADAKRDRFGFAHRDPAKRDEYNQSLNHRIIIDPEAEAYQLWRSVFGLHGVTLPAS